MEEIVYVASTGWNDCVEFYEVFKDYQDAVEEIVRFLTPLRRNKGKLGVGSVFSIEKKYMDEWEDVEEFMMKYGERSIEEFAGDFKDFSDYTLNELKEL